MSNPNIAVEVPTLIVSQTENNIIYNNSDNTITVPLRCVSAAEQVLGRIADSYRVAPKNIIASIALLYTMANKDNIYFYEL